MDVQILRKKNLTKIIDLKFAGSVDLFAKTLNKNKFFIYGLLWSLDKPSGRKITDKTSRLIENELGLPNGFLDNEIIPDDLCTQYIPIIDISTSEQLNSLSLSSQSIAISESELRFNRLKFENLLAIRIADLSMVKYFMPSDIVFIDVSKINLISNKVYFINYNQSFVFRFIQRNPNDIQSLYLIHYDNLEIKEIVNASQIKIIGAPVMKIGALNI